MAPLSNRRRRWLLRGLVFGIWTFLGLFLASQAWAVLYSAHNIPPELRQRELLAPWAELLLVALAECYLWGMLALVIFWLARRFPLSRQRWPVSLPVHVAAGLVLAVVETALSVLVSEVVRHELPKPTFSVGVLKFYFIAKFHQNLMFYAAILAVSQGVDYYRKYRERELRASQLEARLAQTRLQVLKMQLHPHFLFNTLNAISALIHQDVDLADRMVARLGDLLRSTLESADTQEVSLRQELDFIQPYLEIEQARLGPRLTVRLEIDPHALDAAVPNLVLQPLVENAIRHGIAPRAEPGRIEIRARRDDGQLCLQVRDDGPGLPPDPAAPFKEGIGLANTRARLQQLYGAAHRFELCNGPGRGLGVTITIPFREAGSGQGQGGPEDQP